MEISVHFANASILLQLNFLSSSFIRDRTNKDKNTMTKKVLYKEICLLLFLKVFKKYYNYYMYFLSLYENYYNI